MVVVVVGVKGQRGGRECDGGINDCSGKEVVVLVKRVRKGQ